MADGLRPETAAPDDHECSTIESGNPSLSRGNTPRPDAKNTVAHSAAAVCSPSESSALRHHRRGDRATWWDAGQLLRGPIERTGNVEHRTSLLTLAQRRWTR